MADNPKSGVQTRKEKPYDERQKLVRTQCFAHAFFIMPVLLLGNVMLLDAGVPWFDSSIGWLVSFEIAVTLAVVEMIGREAWLPPGAKRSVVWSICYMLLALAGMAAWGFLLWHRATYLGIAAMENGILSNDWIYVITFLCAAIVELSYLLLLLVRRIKNTDEEG